MLWCQVMIGIISSVQSLSRVQLFVTPMNCRTPGLPVHHQLPESIHVHWVSDAIQPSHLLSALHTRWPKYWSFSFSISSSNEYSGLISFRMDWLDLLVVQGTLKRLPQHHSSKTSILRCSAFFMVQFSHPYMTTGKNIVLTRRTFVSKVMPLLFNTLSRFVIHINRRTFHSFPFFLKF